MPTLTRKMGINIGSNIKLYDVNDDDDDVNDDDDDYGNFNNNNNNNNITSSYKEALYVGYHGATIEW